MTSETAEPTSEHGRLVAVNVGEPRVVEWAGRLVETAIWKAPVAGRVPVAGINIAGDRQADLRVHGGPDKAIYAYAVGDYTWWEQELGAPVPLGTFGENLSVDGIDLAAAVVGEVWRVGTTMLELAQPRLPCFKLGIRMGTAEFVDRFADARRYGVYLRIVEAGDVGAGDAIEVLSRPDHGLTATAIGDAAQHDPEPAVLEHMLEVDAVPDHWQEWAARQLTRATRRGER